MNLEQYIGSINQRYSLGNATEHTFRGDLQQLIEYLAPDICATNEPKRQSCGAPDYILTKQDIPIGFIETKAIGDKDLMGLKSTGNKAQFDRYKMALDNLIFTDYLSFYFYQQGQLIDTIAIAEIVGKNIVALPQYFEPFKNLLAHFCQYTGPVISNAKQLAQIMAVKARLLSEMIENTVLIDEKNQADSTINDQMMAFKEVLIADITAKEFADVYAQTLAYGMFAARFHDGVLSTFSRQKAAELIPKSNPFLRKLFGYIAGPDIDDRIKWVVDSLVDVFLACDIKEILKNYGKSTQTEDPIIHFYETFLSEYDPSLRKSRGVWYTPVSVVKFIIKAVDDTLKNEFNLPQGLADTSKTYIHSSSDTNKHSNNKTNRTNHDAKTDTKTEVHKIQILDPATGTGTFLAEVIKHIHTQFSTQQGVWSHYVDTHLLPRLNGFELLMASYAMAHLQLDLLLSDTGYRSSFGVNDRSNQRLRIYLTNSLEESHPETKNLFTNWLSKEANEANYIKRNTPVMCIIGNPPYSGESQNKGNWIMNLMDDYKKEPGGKQKLNERNPKWINDDYVKFIRYGQHFIEKNGSGILAFINPHGFLDNPTFRGMRWNLLNTYDKIYTIDLHGNAKKKETCPDGSVDQNVFDIMQGVSINIFIKTGKKPPNELGKVFHFDLYGKRESKYQFLNENRLNTVNFTPLHPEKPHFFFVPKNNIGKNTYEKGFKLDHLFIVKSTGIVTGKDDIFINNDKKILLQNISNYCSVVSDLNYIQSISYRPFDKQFIYYDTKLLEGSRYKVMQHFLKEENIGLLTIKRSRSNTAWQEVFISNHITAGSTSISSLDINYFFPLYLYPDTFDTHTHNPKRIANLNATIIKQFETQLGLRFSVETDTNTNDTDPHFAAIDVLDYMYAVLHCPQYRQRYKEFLKIDFPRVPYPNNTERFWQWVALGKQLRQLHLLNSPVVEQYITQYPIAGDNSVSKIRYTDQKVWINDTQYFDCVPQVAWDFYIGSYQPAQKWLKDRKNKRLSFDDIMHYQKMIVALFETANIMPSLDHILDLDNDNTIDD